MNNGILTFFQGRWNFQFVIDLSFALLYTDKYQGDNDDEDDESKNSGGDDDEN